MEEKLTSEEIATILEARAKKERSAQTKGAEQLMEILDTPQTGMSKKYTFDMFGDEVEADDDRPPAA
jgi:hypothetical protein